MAEDVIAYVLERGVVEGLEPWLEFFDEVSVWGKVGRKIVGEDGVLVKVDGTLVGLSYMWAVLCLEGKKLSLLMEQRGHHNIWPIIFW